jgi:hypothetical protein
MVMQSVRNAFGINIKLRGMRGTSQLAMQRLGKDGGGYYAFAQQLRQLFIDKS